MPHRTFLAFMLLPILAMLLFIALPIVSVAVQSLYVEHDKVLVTVENCQPFGGCTTETRVDTEATEQIRAILNHFSRRPSTRAISSTSGGIGKNDDSANARMPRAMAP